MEERLGQSVVLTILSLKVHPVEIHSILKPNLNFTGYRV